MKNSNYCTSAKNFVEKNDKSRNYFSLFLQIIPRVPFPNFYFCLLFSRLGHLFTYYLFIFKSFHCNNKL